LQKCPLQALRIPLIRSLASRPSLTGSRSLIPIPTTLSILRDRTTVSVSIGRTGLNSGRKRSRLLRLRRSRSTSTVPDSGSRDRIVGRSRSGIQIEKNPRIISAISPRNRNTSRQRNRSARRNTDLNALHVELCATDTGSLMEGNDLGTKEVVACGEIGKGDAVLSAVGDQFVDGPLPA